MEGEMLKVKAFKEGGKGIERKEGKRRLEKRKW